MSKKQKATNRLNEGGVPIEIFYDHSVGKHYVAKCGLDFSGREVVYISAKWYVFILFWRLLLKKSKETFKKGPLRSEETGVVAVNENGKLVKLLISPHYIGEVWGRRNEVGKKLPNITINGQEIELDYYMTPEEE